MDRRALLSGGFLAGVGLVLASCQTTVKRATSLPNPLWPDQDPSSLPASRAASRTVVIQQPAAPVSRGPVVDVGVPTGVMPRSAWTSAKPLRGVADPMGGVTRITVHHSGMDSAGLDSQGEVARILDSIRRAHMARGKQWADIGYHYLIDPSGRVWEGRPVDLQGAHVKEHNEHNLGICVLGNFDQQSPSGQSLAALDRFVASQMRRFRVAHTRVYTHQEIMPTECPGRQLQRHMLAARSGRGTLRVALG